MSLVDKINQELNLELYSIDLLHLSQLIDAHDAEITKIHKRNIIDAFDVGQANCEKGNRDIENGQDYWKANYEGK